MKGMYAQCNVWSKSALSEQQVGKNFHLFTFQVYEHDCDIKGQSEFTVNIT